jgi:hypothetical protein
MGLYTVNIFPFGHYYTISNLKPGTHVGNITKIQLLPCIRHIAVRHESQLLSALLVNNRRLLRKMYTT